MPIVILLMKAAGLGPGGPGVLTGIARYLCLKPPELRLGQAAKDEEGEGEGVELELEGEAAAARHEELVTLQQRKEDEVDYEVMRTMLRAMAGAGALVVLGGAPYAVYGLHQSWAVALREVGCAMGLFLPVGLIFAGGASPVANHLPMFFMALTITSSALSMAGLPLHLLGVHQDVVELYVTGLRIGVEGASSLLVIIFCNRYARLQRRKAVSPGSSDWLVSFNSASIPIARLLGCTLGGVWLYSVYSAEMPYTLLEMSSLAYMYTIQCHLMVPSADHDDRAEVNIVRNACLGAHALLVVSQLSSQTHPVAASMQRLLAFATNAAWFGTFNGEWTDLSRFSLEQDAEPAKGVRAAALAVTQRAGTLGVDLASSANVSASPSPTPDVPAPSPPPAAGGAEGQAGAEGGGTAA
eukprot:TRINITY_DN7216_c0_g1_i1.p1 TRINITY_DN7216_c0_g1~~TRINITY_DN7216_c0_g1_i1.p1  ORF type:complete len:439 (+),score=145.05 TRINITY_DN7216_c0_g1_i1:87-1319(+)